MRTHYLDSFKSRAGEHLFCAGKKAGLFIFDGALYKGLLFLVCLAIFMALTSCTPPTKVFKSTMQRDYDDNLYWLEFHCFKDNSWECVKMTQGRDSTIIYTGTYEGNVFKDTSEANHVTFKITAYYSISDKKVVSLPPFLQRTDEVTIKKGELDWENVLSSVGRP